MTTAHHRLIEEISNIRAKIDRLHRALGIKERALTKHEQNSPAPASYAKRR